jgi:hypothetical protein
MTIITIHAKPIIHKPLPWEHTKHTKSPEGVPASMPITPIPTTYPCLHAQYTKSSYGPLGEAGLTKAVHQVASRQASKRNTKGGACVSPAATSHPICSAVSAVYIVRVRVSAAPLPLAFHLGIKHDQSLID